MTSDILDQISQKNENLLQLSTAELLYRFGEGNATPGSGSAAALMALLASSVICAFAKLTISNHVNKGFSVVEKTATEKKLETATSILKRLTTAGSIVKKLEEEVMPRLKCLFEEDSRKFQNAIDARKKRDKTEKNDTKELYKNKALQKLMEANEILLEIANLSFEICDCGLSIWPIGLTYAKGDAGVGINGSLAAITTCLQVAYVNVQTLAKETDKTAAQSARQACDEIQTKLLEKRQKFDVMSQYFYDEVSQKIK